MRAAKEAGAWERPPGVEKGVTNGGVAPAEAVGPIVSEDARGP